MTSVWDEPIPPDHPNAALLRTLKSQHDMTIAEIAAYRRRLRNPLYRLKELVRHWWET